MERIHELDIASKAYSIHFEIFFFSGCGMVNTASG